MKKNKAFTLIELIANLGFVSNFSNEEYDSSETTPTWIYNYDYWYWTMSPYLSNYVWIVLYSGYLDSIDNPETYTVTSYHGGGGTYSSVVRPVIVLPKSAISN